MPFRPTNEPEATIEHARNPEITSSARQNLAGLVPDDSETELARIGLLSFWGIIYLGIFVGLDC